jgi:DNA-binding transcriptional LysR family regulator
MEAMGARTTPLPAPLIEATVLHMNNHAQVEGLLNASIMLGIGYFGSALDEDEREQLCTRLLLRSPVGIGCSKHRQLPKRAGPKLRDFRHDKFISFDPEYGYGYEQWVRGLCQRFGRFEPELEAIANSIESLVSMVASGRTAAIDFYLLTEAEIQFELLAIWKKTIASSPDNLIGLLYDLIAKIGPQNVPVYDLPAIDNY